MRPYALSVCLMLVTGFSACRSATNTSGQQVADISTHDIRVTDIDVPTQTGILTNVTQASPQTAFPPPVTVSEDTLNFSDLILSTLNDSECSTVCWHGIEVGESSGEASLLALEDYFKRELKPSDIGRLDDEGFIKRYIQFNTENSGAHFTITTDSSTDMVKQVTITPVYLQRANLQSILQPLGAPEYMFAQVASVNEINALEVRLLLLYRQGYVFYLTVQLSDTDSMIKYCLDDTVTLWITLMESYDFNNTPLTAVQGSVINVTIADFNLVPIEEIFGLTPEQLAEAAIAEEGACFDLAAQS